MEKNWHSRHFTEHQVLLEESYSLPYLFTNITERGCDKLAQCLKPCEDIDRIDASPGFSKLKELCEDIDKRTSDIDVIYYSCS